jgi:hypothetical protein
MRAAKYENNKLHCVRLAFAVHFQSQQAFTGMMDTPMLMNSRSARTSADAGVSARFSLCDAYSRRGVAWSALALMALLGMACKAEAGQHITNNHPMPGGSGNDHPAIQSCNSGSQRCGLPNRTCHTVKTITYNALHMPYYVYNTVCTQG